MVIIIGAVITWIAVTIFSLVPKKLTPFEIIFLFCTNTIFELSSFSILHVNLKWIVVGPGVSNGIADLMFRLIELPLLLVVTSNMLLYKKWIKWFGVAAIILFTIIVQFILLKMKIITFHHWKLIYSVFYMLADVAFSRLLTWIITSIETKETA